MWGPSDGCRGTSKTLLVRSVLLVSMVLSVLGLTILLKMVLMVLWVLLVLVALLVQSVLAAAALLQNCFHKEKHSWKGLSESVLNILNLNTHSLLLLLLFVC